MIKNPYTGVFFVFVFFCTCPPRAPNTVWHWSQYQSIFTAAKLQQPDHPETRGDNSGTSLEINVHLFSLFFFLHIHIFFLKSFRMGSSSESTLLRRDAITESLANVIIWLPLYSFVYRTIMSWEDWGDPVEEKRTSDKTPSTLHPLWLHC